MFHAPIGRFQLELFIFITHFPPSSHPTLSTGLVGVEVTSVSWLGPTGQKHKYNSWDDGGK